MDTPWSTPVCTAAALRLLPAPAAPPPGPLDGVVGLLLARAAPFDAVTQQALHRQNGWGCAAPAPIGEVRTRGRWQATPALKRLTAATPPPASLLAALALLESVAPCRSGDAAAAMLTSRVTETAMHPAGVLALARWYGIPTTLTLDHDGTTTVVLTPMDALGRSTLRRIVLTTGRAGFVVLPPRGPNHSAALARGLDYALARDGRLFREDQTLVRVDDRSSGLANYVARMLITAPRPLTTVELQEGLARAWRFRRQRIPSVDILGTWLQHQAWLLVNADEVSILGDLPPSQRAAVMDTATIAIAELLADGQTASWHELLGALTLSGLEPQTAKMTGHTTPLLVRVRPNTYQLKGAAPTSGGPFVV